MATIKCKGLTGVEFDLTVTMGSTTIDPANRHYQIVLDDIIEQGADCFEGDIPAELQAAADAKAADQ